LAAIGDLHIRTTVSGSLWEEVTSLQGRADALVVAGDITDGGRLVEAEHAAELFRAVPVPVVAVLGNHDLRCLRRTAFRRVLEAAGVVLLDGEGVVLTTRFGTRVGFAGVGGAGGGFWPVEGPVALHNRAMKALAVRAKREASRLDLALDGLEADLRIAVTHFAPTSTTLGREPVGKYWMLGNSELGRIIDRHPVDLVVHGHAHLGNLIGQTTGGTPVLNVATAVGGGVVIRSVAPSRPPSRPAVVGQIAGGRG
jgi:Icc-related predicted phosphoesterase